MNDPWIWTMGWGMTVGVGVGLGGGGQKVRNWANYNRINKNKKRNGLIWHLGIVLKAVGKGKNTGVRVCEES